MQAPSGWGFLPRRVSPGGETHAIAGGEVLRHVAAIRHRARQAGTMEDFLTSLISVAAVAIVTAATRAAIAAAGMEVAAEISIGEGGDLALAADECGEDCCAARPHLEFVSGRNFGLQRIGRDILTCTAPEAPWSNSLP